ncbi:MAG TPA: SDR family oxidoreductase [Jatrophihabitantaceae bacterium]|jgi:3-oxoacyl-[acyl-carrier protein] reductase
MPQQSVPDDSWFDGKVAIVTGASRGIGRAIADRIAERGCAVLLNGRDPETLDLAVTELGERVAGLRGSINDPELPQRLVDAAIEHFGRVDFIVNNAAATAWYGPLLDVDRDAFVKTLVANTWPALALVQSAVRAGMGVGAAVVNISTTGAQRVHSTTGPYTASKAALENLTATLARELGPRGITVNAVAPGLVQTELARVLWEGDRQEPEIKLVPMQRLGQPADIAAAVEFLLGPGARWLNGSVIRVDGGRFHVGGESADLIGVYS